MDLQGRNLSIEMQGPDVQLLQRELRQLGFQIDDPDGVFAASTRAAVANFQLQRGWEPTGIVDEPLARAINQAVGPGRPDGPATPPHRFWGTLTLGEQPAAVGTTVLAWVNGNRAGSTTVQDGGNYAIDVRPGVDGATVRFTVYDREAQPSATFQTGGYTRLDLSADASPEKPLVVRGVVQRVDGTAATGVLVRAVDRDLRSEETLDETRTNPLGAYEIRYHPDQFKRAEKGAADLVVRALDEQGNVLAASPILFNARAEETVNLVIDGDAVRGPSEFERLLAGIEPLLDGLSPADLREDSQYQDVSFLAGETGTDRLTIAVWIACFRLADKTAREETPLPPEAFYGFLRQGQPSIFSDTLLDDMQHPDRMALLEDKILRGLTDIIPDRLRSLLEQAIADNIIPARIGPAIDSILETLHQIKLRYAAGGTFGGGKGTIEQLLALTPEAKQEQAAFMTAFTAHAGPIDTFWKKLEEDRVLEPETVQRVKLSFEVGSLTRNHIPLVGELVNQLQRGDLTAKRELATFDRTAWVEMFMRQGPDGNPIGVPANIDGDTDQAKMEQYAAILEQQFERAYPTTSFAAKLSRSRQTAVAGTSDLVHFVDHNPAFHLDRFRVDHYIAEHEGALDGIQSPEALVADLNTVQRVFKLQPTFQVVDALLSRNIDSAQQIYFMGQGQFQITMAGSGVNTIDARRIYRKAENTYALALALFGDYNLAVNGVSPFGVPVQSPDQATQAKIAALPNLQTLFGSLDYCECTHCRSVYSPAAYFVDTLRFLGERGTHGTTINSGKNVRQVLLERRPDLGEIELSCENTNTPLPYIDLVNETLEDVVAPPTPVTLNSAIEADLVAGPVRPAVLNDLVTKGIAISLDALVYTPDSRGQWAVRDAESAYRIFKTGTTLHLLPTRQTFLSAAELRANPEYTNGNAHTKLAQEVFPLTLPFNLWQTQVQAYLDHLGVPRPRLLELFQRKQADGVTLAPTDIQIDTAWLGITETERKILTGALPGKQPWDFWGLAETGNTIPDPDYPADPTRNRTGAWISVLSNVTVLLNRAGLTYQQLQQLLDMRFVNPDGSVTIDDTADTNAANCDPSTFTIQNLSGATLDRMQWFIRLWRTLGCTMWELDLLLPSGIGPATAATPITDAVLQEISRIKRLHERTGLDWWVLAALYRGINHTAYVDRGREGAPAVQTLYQRLFRNKLVDAAGSFPPHPLEISGPISARVPAILAAVRIAEADLDLILADLGFTPATTLDLGVLSRIYRIKVLARALGLSVDQFLRLKRLWAQDPFASSAATLQFIKLVDLIASSRFSVLELDYLLAHRVTPTSGVALEEKVIIALLQTLRLGLQAIDDDVRLPAGESAAAYVTRKLGALPALTADADQQIALSIIDGSWQGTQTGRDARIDTFFAGVLDLTVAKTRLTAIAGGLSPADRQAAVDARFAYVQPALESYLRTTQSEEFIRQKVAEALRLDVPSAATLLSGLNLPGSADPLLTRLNDPRLIAKLSDGSYQFALDETAFPAVFRSLRLLHKAALVIEKLEMTADEVRWWLMGNHAPDLGWMRAGDFPTDTTTSVTIDRWVALQQFFTWKSKLPRSERTAFEFASRLLDATVPSATNVTELAQLTGWEAADITALTVAFHWVDAVAGLDAIKQELRRPANLVRLADCIRALRRLGVNAARAITWATAEPGSADADSLKQTVKAKYDLTQWQQVIQPIQDDLREQKRQALVNWLVAHPDQAQGQNWSDANGLYSHFLIDVEMSACMLTSRLKQATASAQLFVQRCLLNLERDILAKTDLDPKWKQWKWMRRYRVWEANRKVFLYPENWIEPELRDEKSPFFKELEQELLQNDITNETAEQAYLNYLEKLDRVANLEIRAMHHEVISQDESVLHVIGRSRSSQSPEHYYRRRINGARWTAWEKIELDITANHLVAGVHNRRLYLLWPQFLIKADQPASVTTPTGTNASASLAQPNRYWEIRLAWSELKKGKWTPKVLSDSFITEYLANVGGDKPSNVEFRVRQAPNIQVRVYGADEPALRAPRSYRLFNKLGKQLTPEGAFSEHLIGPAESRYANNLIQHTSGTHYFYHSVIEEYGKPHTLSAHENAVTIRVLRGISPNGTYSVIDSTAQGFAGAGSFFLWDPRHTYFADYTWRMDSSYVSRAWRHRLSSSFQFFIHYHPFVELFIKELNIWGIKGLLNRRIQLDPASIPGSPAPFNFADYQPEPNVVEPLPVEDVDFTYRGAYAPYNWELFFHVPFFIANRLSANQQFEEALEWFHAIFDPTSTDTATPNPDTPQQKFWITKPFYQTTKAEYYRQKIEAIMLAIAKGDAELIKQVQEWRDSPFNPHLIARMRTVAYQKAVLIKYIQNLIAWGDQLFGQDTIESINEATQLYVLAASVLGPRPKSIPKTVPNPIRTFYQLQQEGIDRFGNVLKTVENLLPPVSSGGTRADDTPELPRLDVLYFCIPNNDKLLGLWDTVADRLFKIRHCMNIEGVVRQLPLFEPPIDPALLVKAAAAGLDLGAVLSDMNAPLPLYRFTVMIQRALELCSDVKALGAAMLAALERRDAEELTLLRSGHQQEMLKQVRLIKERQVDEALRTKEALDESRHMIEARRNHYRQLIADGWNGWEKAWLGLTVAAMSLETAGTVLNTMSASVSLIPDLDAGAAGFGASPTVKLKFGGKNVANGAGKAAEVLKGLANVLQMGAGMTSTIGSYARRAQEWELQKLLAEKELPQVDKQIAAAEIRHQIAIQDLANQDTQIEQAQKEDDYLRTKFTNQELYHWMVGKLSTVYFQSYQLTYEVAKRAERCFRYELGLTDSSYIRFGYWDSLKQGLLCGEQLGYDLKRLEAAYYAQNRREYELTKHISLAQIDPVALLKLRQNGECFVDIPETAFDMDYPGHYFRRIKSVGLSLPCTVGPYTTVACTLTLTSNHLRKDATLLANAYERETTNDDPRFRDDIAAIQSIATSSAQNDRGMFELSFRDERYLPFEGAGAISTWHIKLNHDLPQFDFTTLADVIIHLDYTAREGGELLRAKAVEQLDQRMNALALAEGRRGMYRVIDLRREYPDKWYQLLHPASPADDQQLILDDVVERLPYFTRSLTTNRVRIVEVVARMNDAATYEVLFSPLGTTETDLLTLTPDPTYQGLHRALKDLTGSEIDFGAWTLKVRRDGATDFKSLPTDAVRELFLIINYASA